MKNLQLLCRSICSLLITLSFALNVGGEVQADQPVATKQYIVHVTLKNGLPTGSVQAKTQKIEANPMIVVLENVESEMAVGGGFNVGDQSVFYGTRLKLTVKAMDEGQVLLEGVMEVSSAQNKEPGMVVKASSEIHFSRPAQLKKQVMFFVQKEPGPQRWLEVLVEPVQAEKTK